MRTRIESLSNSHVRIIRAPYMLNGITGDHSTFEVYAPYTGGYVRFTDGRQVCDGMSSRGNTLHWDPRFGPLVDLIRAQHRIAMRRLKEFDE